MMFPGLNSADKGRFAEDFTVHFLMLSGYSVLSRNYSVYRIGEIDIVALKGETIIFIEVKGRVNEELFAGYDGLVPLKKLRRIQRTASIYMDNNQVGDLNCKIVLAYVHIACDKYHTKINFRTLL